MLKDLFYDGKKTASCTTLMKWAKSKGQFVSSGFRAGDIIFYDWDSNRADSEHTGIFTGEISNGRLVVIEGNTGDAVKEKLQSTSSVIGAWRPQYENDAQATAIITWAYAQIGTAEVPLGSNNVRYNTIYYGRVINDPNYAWCMVFVWCAFQEADKYITETPVPTPAPAPVTYVTGMRELKRGDTGHEVEVLQTLLIAAGYKLPKYGADGEFGAETESALKSYQKEYALDADGICGEKTWTKLLKGV